MRLIEIKQKLESSSGVLDLVIQNKGNNTFSLTNWNTFKQSILKLGETPVYVNEINKIKNWSHFHKDNNSFNVNATDIKTVQASIKHIQQTYAPLIESMKYIDSEVDETLISVKIPHPANLSELNSYVNSVDKAFTPILINDKINGQVTFQSFDKGSDWINFIVGNPVAVALVASISWAAAVVYKKTREARIFNKFADGLDVKNESMKDLELGISKLIEQVIEIEANAIHKEYYDDKDHEQIQRIQLSIKLLSDLIQKGAEIHPALNQPEKVVNLFPDFNKLEKIESRIKKISKKAGNP